ncbi:hypothetical protein HK414_27780 [Ramlibacter terrae]|uniref:Uncharacterized protein n=1 Tax=Ramlibacter terrae TaxID=2732511 RepID=A0ABX6P802_9BURK|nr:hypothetical protein HK414_27780 [Ramlibacter terrae]
MPYPDTAHAAYRVDPVLVQWGSRVEPVAGSPPSPASNRCPTTPKGQSGSRSAGTPVDVMCPLDLDTYVFPQDLKSGTVAGSQRTAYERVLACMGR